MNGRINLIWHYGIIGKSRSEGYVMETHFPFIYVYGAGGFTKILNIPGATHKRRNFVDDTITSYTRANDYCAIQAERSSYKRI